MHRCRLLLGGYEICGAVTFCTAYVAIIVRSRLAGMDEYLEEAAMDLGGGPVRVLLDIDVNALASSIIAAVTCGVVAAGVILRRQYRQRIRDEHIRETV